MEKYVIIVRDYSYHCPTDNYLYAMDRYFQIPIVELDYYKNMGKAMDVFNNMFGKHFSHFLNVYYELIPQK